MAAVKTALVTGANKGIGFHVAKGLVAEGYHVVLGCRDGARAAEAASAIRETAPKDLKVDAIAPIEYAHPETFKAAAEKFQAMYPGGIDVLINNAGMAFAPDSRVPFCQQAEITTTVNYFGSVALDEAFFPLLNDQARVVNVASRIGQLDHLTCDKLKAQLMSPKLTQEDLNNIVKDFVMYAKNNEHVARGFPKSAYSMSKIAVNALTRIQARDPSILKRQICVNAACPGYCSTDMTGNLGPRPAEEGAEVMLWLATAPEHMATTGEYYGERRQLDWTSAPEFVE